MVFTSCQAKWHIHQGWISYSLSVRLRRLDIGQVLFWDRHAKKRTRPTSSQLDRAILVNKGFITLLSMNFFLRGTRELLVSRSSSQSQCSIRFILLTHGVSTFVRVQSKYQRCLWRIEQQRFAWFYRKHWAVYFGSQCCQYRDSD